MASSGKRPIVAERDDGEKRPRGSELSASAQAQQLLAQAEAMVERQNIETEALDANALKRRILGFEKAINANTALRMKYPDQPDRFMDAELELYQALKSLHAVAASPELYPIFVKSKCVPSLLGLLLHENADISNDALDLLQEMLDAEDASPDDLGVLVDALLEHEGAEAIAEQLNRLTNDATDEDEASAAHSCLSIFESMLEAQPSASARLCSSTPLLPWLLQRIKARGFHAVKLYASEVLALLLQQQPSNQARLGELDGILSLLTAAAQYKRKEPADLEEAELIENVFNALAMSLELGQNQALFLRAEGLELMVMTLKEQKYAARCALKVLDQALDANGANCERFVDIRGFKTLFPLLGASPPPPLPFAKGKGEKEAAQRSHDEHVVSILVTLFHQLPEQSERRQRLLGKFVEEGLGKALLALVLRRRYDARVAEAELLAEQSLARQLRGGGGDEDEDDDEEEEEVSPEERIYLARVDAGLPTLQKLDILLGYLATAKLKQLRQALLQGLYEHGRSLHDVAANLDEAVQTKLGLNEASHSADAVGAERLGRMNEAVKALLLKYQPAPRATGDDVD